MNFKMDCILKIAAGSVISVILMVTLRKRNSELSLALSLLVCAVLFLCGLQSFRVIWNYLTDLGNTAEIITPLFGNVMKVCGISILTHITMTFCQEAGEAAVGKVVELCGGAAAVCAMMPMLDAIVSLTEDLLGG